MKDTIESALQRTLESTKTYQDLVDDGVQMERLFQSEQFKRYQKLLAEAFVQLAIRISYAPTQDLPVMQGALIQHRIIMNLPDKILGIATNLVEQRRSDA